MEILSSGNNWNHFGSNSNLAMASGVCPNCRFNTSSCSNTSAIPMQQVPLGEHCVGSGCHSASPKFLIPGNVNIPLTYVCRHWVQAASMPCPHCYSCRNRLNLPLNCVQCLPRSQLLLNGELNHMNAINLKNLQSSPFGKENIDHSLLHTQQKPFEPCQNGLVQPPIHVPCNTREIWNESDDVRILAATKSDLEECGWYYGRVTWQEANSLLSNKAEGTFLVRDSSSKRCPYALSVQTSQGPTSIRIEYERGQFWLACEKKGVTPQLKGVIELIEFYKSLATNQDKLNHYSNTPNNNLTADGNHVWVDHKGVVFSPIKILQPYRRKPQSLQHMCRLVIKNSSCDVDQLPLSVQQYLRSYQHSL